MFFEMSERYGPCKTCGGSGSRDGDDCGGCDGTGFDGDAMYFIDPSYRLAITQERVKTSHEKVANAYELATQAFVSHTQRKSR